MVSALTYRQGGIFFVVARATKMSLPRHFLAAKPIYLIYLYALYRLCICNERGRIATKFPDNIFSSYTSYWYMAALIRPLWLQMWM